ncbi:PREDICTED: uncharacterized protein LOC105365745 [Ceratosolen solmsi marchali]|uniref:Uncharacterized protein LOC105365745 n=1 Tax=Ceratosolen solmsi marchali TaxID=326594 RepID=A0AAJ6YQB0_9HYME|nr:PREDICTED: uncharacterized protein LOC105365745 [Ceratosolen solmsi marchali]
MITFHAPTCDTIHDVSKDGACSENVDNSKNSTTIKINEPELESDDDETIATFVTSTGQQLALYAVEDSDEIFAVALYDESGEPPSNFHFLLKADVERLIGEGAVKTVKKPTLQQKRESKPLDKKEEIIYETYEETKRRYEKIEEIKKKSDIKANIVEVPKHQKLQKKKVQNLERTNTYVMKSSRNKNAIRQPHLTKTTKKISNASHSRFDSRKETNIGYTSNESYIIDHFQDDIDSDAEIIEQSTVQYMLCDGDHSDSELTFDELQASLLSFNTSKASLNASKTRSLESQSNERKKDIGIKFSSTLKNSPNATLVYSQKKESVTVCRTYKNQKKSQLSNNLLKIQKKVIKEDIEDPTLSDFSTFEDGPNSSDELPQNDMQNSLIEPHAVKVKRSRKQQLTVVNRTDSEIIIQPASVFSEEEEEPVVTKKRGRRKKKLLPDPDYNPRKPIRRTRRTHRSVEVIEIDIDENDRSNIMEITLDGKKGKGSSDKENDIISVGDSDESDEDLNKKSKDCIMQCSHCNRKFRKRRALERHLEICPKSPANIQKLEERKACMIGKGKKFKCKSCNEFFDIAVALARHVRAVHSPRKRGRPPKHSWLRNDSDSSDIEDSMDESSPEPEREPRRRGRPRIKSSLSKDESPTPDIELKLDSSFETFTEPRKRGRPPKKKPSKERSASPESMEKNINLAEHKMQSMERPIMEFISEPRKRGRPSKKSLSKEGRSVSPDLKDKSDMLDLLPIQIPKKRGRPSKRNLSKDERSTTPEAEEKNESYAEISSEPRKRGRPSKRSTSKDKRSESPEVVVKIEILSESNSNDDEMTTEVDEKNEDSMEAISEFRKNVKFNKEKFLVDEKSVMPESEMNMQNLIESSDKSQQKSKLNQDKFLKDDISQDLEIEIKVESSVDSLGETRKQDSQSTDIALQDERSVTPEVDEKEITSLQNILVDEKDKIKIKKKILSPNRTWKVKKLNCADCGKWFSSAAALTTHRLQHRTKTSGHLAHRCPLCKKLIPLELFAKHLTMAHGKPMSERSGEGGGSGGLRRPIYRHKKWAARTLRSTN